MMKMFNLIDIGERAGSGIPNIFSVWKQQGWSEPTILVSSEPDRSTLVLPLFKSDDKKVTIKSDDIQFSYYQCLLWDSKIFLIHTDTAICKKSISIFYNEETAKRM